jgi:phenylacetate-CoA ligase
MTEHYDGLETRDPEQRERELFARLPDQVANAQLHAPTFAQTLKGVDASACTDPVALSQLPVTRKSDLIELQKHEPPFGGLAATPVGHLGKIFASPGPIYEPEGKRVNYWRMARALYAAGFREGDLVYNTFSYHFSPAGSMLESGAHAVGCVVFPAGVGQTELQVQTINDLKPAGYVGTPSFLKIILEKAVEMGLDLSSLKNALVSGEALPPNLRSVINEHGVDVLQCYATADLGLIAYESGAKEGLILDEEVIVELVRPGTGDLVAENEVGEVVVTTFNPDYPLIRFGTGDLSAVLPGVSPCGRTNTRIKGWMGRADQTTKVKGMFVHPSQVNEIIKRHTEVLKARLLVDNDGTNDIMLLKCEVRDGTDQLADAIARSIRDVCKLRGQAVFSKPGSLPNDGKVIDDVRTYD